MATRDSIVNRVWSNNIFGPLTHFFLPHVSVNVLLPYLRSSFCISLSFWPCLPQRTFFLGFVSCLQFSKVTGPLKVCAWGKKYRSPGPHHLDVRMVQSFWSGCIIIMKEWGILHASSLLFFYATCAVKWKLYTCENTLLLFRTVHHFCKYHPKFPMGKAFILIKGWPQLAIWDCSIVFRILHGYVNFLGHVLY